MAHWWSGVSRCLRHTQLATHAAGTQEQQEDDPRVHVSLITEYTMLGKKIIVHAIHAVHVLVRPVVFRALTTPAPTIVCWVAVPSSDDVPIVLASPTILAGPMIVQQSIHEVDIREQSARQWWLPSDDLAIVILSNPHDSQTTLLMRVHAICLCIVLEEADSYDANWGMICHLCLLSVESARVKAYPSSRRRRRRLVPIIAPPPVSFEPPSAH
mmetsp:Transcript_13128/g.24184  ORF Transcript_13128/g.24184 Transcript_13128/m.24184 type:complete len:213 (-) Transcript_13128:900-1538(-)